MKSLFLIFLPIYLLCGEFRVATYNVENLFDLRKSGSEYTEYIPFTGYGWNEENFRKKLENISRVICDMKPDILALQEIESDDALLALQNELSKCGVNLPQRAIAKKKVTAVRCALLSKFPIVDIKELDPDPKSKLRNILEVTVEVDGRRVTLFVNHWKSRSGPESLRLKSAKVLAERVSEIKNDYIILGDLNSNWNEWREILHSKRVNDTGGITGIGHILKTQIDGKPVYKRKVKSGYHTNLWLELPPSRRWSHNFFGHKSALDHIVLPPSMFDDKGVNYVDRSFRPFKPYYLFKSNGAIFRWQKAKRGHGKHLGEGYSDHLPIYADFTTSPFRFKKGEETTKFSSQAAAKRTVLNVADLYEKSPGRCNIILKKVVVIYKKGSIAIIKAKGDRAIAVYKDIDSLELGHEYDIAVERLYNYKGVQEITKLNVLEDFGKRDIGPLLSKSLKKIDLQKDLSEVVAKVEGVYKRGYLYYGNGLKVKLYFKNRSSRPKSGERIVLKNVRIGVYKNRPELVVD